ncbi:leucine efflux protein LeuE [Janibacter alkaliphilus]|uniref:Leucine efflux protein n=1 Tax=Janibacter alkaliphilus TaxID=1069963 RepID=A0A852X8T2_9MICO|nr:leucine efflux protein [Janibacter alkaliphilus]
MLGITDLSSYLVGLVVIILLPGPNSLYVLSVAARRGVRQGFQGAAGVWVGDIILMTLSAAGVASLLQANELAFAVVKYLGAGYLGWLALGMLRGGWSLWRSRRSVSEEIDAAAADQGLTPVAGERPFRRALVISLLNPKAILFFVAFFVQFVDPGYAQPWLSFLALGTLATVASMAYLSVLIFGGTRLADLFRRRRGLSAAGSTGVGAVFLGFAVKLSIASA